MKQVHRNTDMGLKVFAWNMQRGSSILPSKSASKEEREKAGARLRLLSALCNDHDLGFITEAGADLTQAVSAPNTTNVLVPKGMGWWHAAWKEDTQHDSKGCKNLLFFKGGAIDKYDLNILSGKVTSCRYPAAAAALVEGKRALFASIHATSGGGGRANMEVFMDYVDELPERKKPELVVFGGDLNSSSSQFIQPKQPTHQGGNILDGFYMQGYDGETSITASGTAIYKSHPKDGWGNPHKEGLGWYIAHNNYLWRVSDHAPISTTALISVEMSNSDDE
jgi:hypothetical protein